MKLCILVCFMLAANSLWAGGRLNVFGRIGDNRYSTSVSHEELQASSHWKPSDGLAPIHQLDALDQAKRLLIAEFPHFGAFQVAGLTLAESNTGTWLYKITFLSKPAAASVQAAGGSISASMLTYFILLNGKSVSPVAVEAK